MLILSLIAACSQSGSNAKSDTATIDSLVDRFPEKTRPLLSDLNGFYEVIDTINIDNKVMRYSIFLQKTFDTVFGQRYSGCTFNRPRTVFSNSLYQIIPTFNTYSGMKIKDSLYSIAIEMDTSEVDFTINKDYQTKVDEMRNSNPQLADDRMDSSYLYIQNGIARYRYEFTKPGVQSRIRLQFIYKDVLITIVGKYILGKLAKVSEMKTIIESFEIEEVELP